MSLRSEMKKYFIHEKTDFIDDEEAVTDFNDLKDRDIDNDGDTDDSDEYLHKRFGTIAKMDEAKFKKGDIVIPSLGPHKGDKHKIIHDFKDGSYNIAPLSPRNIKYKLGAAKAKEAQLKLVNENAIDELLVGNDFIDPNTMSAIMAAVPAIVGLSATINWKEEITDWLKGLAKTDSKLKDSLVSGDIDESVIAGSIVDPDTMSAIMAAVPMLVGLSATVHWKEEIADWLKGLAKKDSKLKDSLVSGDIDEENTSSATPGYDTPNAFGNADKDTIEADGWKKAPKTNRIFKPMEGTSTFKKLMANMYNIGNGQPSINEAQKYDIEAAIKDIREFNRGNIDLEQLATSIVKNLGYEPTDNNVDNVINHLRASTARGRRIPEDPAIVRELYPMLESVSYREYKKDPSSTPKQKVNKGIAEVNKMLGEMEKIVNNNLRLKQEAGVDSSHFWKSTSTRFAKINERMTHISNRLKELSK
jgi:hypothetical protein